LAVSASSAVNSNSDSRASHEYNKSTLLDKWLDQQWDLWKSINTYVNKMAEDAIALDAKKDNK
jgi:hypothetical protein